MRHVLSPWMVDRKWPTCIFFAMLGEEKSTRTRFFLGASLDSSSDAAKTESSSFN